MGHYFLDTQYKWLSKSRCLSMVFGLYVSHSWTTLIFISAQGSQCHTSALPVSIMNSLIKKITISMYFMILYLAIYILYIYIEYVTHYFLFCSLPVYFNSMHVYWEYIIPLRLNTTYFCTIWPRSLDIIFI